jgi:hypothetical protein
MRSLLAWFLGGLLLAAGPSAVSAQTLPAQSVRRQQQVQQQVRAMARELVGSVLDVQLQQLRENRLTSNQLYADIRGMRERLDALIEAEMPEVVRLLEQVESAGTDQGKQLYLAARQKSRQIVVRLLVERQNLVRRLKIAEMALQVQQLIDAQRKVLGATEALPDQPASRRESLNLSALEDQRDVRAVFDRFFDALGETARQPGPLMADAATGLKLLQEKGVGGELAAAENRLQGASFAQAAASQRAVISKLEALLSQIQEAEGMKEPSQSETAQRFRDLSKRQEQLREATRRADLSQPESEKLVSRQVDIRKQIANLQESLSGQPDVQRPLQAAQKSADDAATDMFDQKNQEATAKQHDVIRKLEEAAKQAEREDALDSANLTADELEQRIKDLEEAVDALRKADQQQKVASETSEKNPSAAAQQERQVDTHLVSAEKPQQLPGNVRSRVGDARQAVSSAEANMNRDHERRPSVEKANNAVEQALSEALTALADARRKQWLAKIGELSAAADALDEAAKIERGVAKDAGQAAQHEGLNAEKANDMAQQQQEVGQVVGSVAEGVKNIAEKATEKLREAEKPIREASKQLDSAKRKPGQPSKPAAQQAAEQAQQAAEKIADAANEVRKEMQTAADQLEKLAQEQFHQVDEARKNVEAELAQSLQQDDAADTNQQADRAGELARQTVPLDANATAALRGAQQAAGAQKDFQEDLGEAAGSLTARQEQIGQDLAKVRAKTHGRQQAAGTPAGPQPGATPSGPKGGNHPASGMLAEGPATSAAAGGAPDTEQAALQKPWIAKLPPELRKAIRSNAQQRPPRGYEERLQEYFQNLE